ncbi:ABC transporter substrate-binding protein [Salipiger sp.]|uniref:ABC transporter substrate-binding protein n=1 Tax=Salipiger sp. TaxID=2078585 RepID=UPI003A96BCC6
MPVNTSLARLASGISRRAFIAGTAGIAATATLPGRVFARETGTLRIGQIALGGENLDPTIEVRSTVSHIHLMLYDCLFEIGPDSELIPGLAESHTVDESGTVWTFKLREGVQFHGGYGEVTAEDAVFSINRWMQPEVASSGRTALVDAVKDMRVIDRYTFEISTGTVKASLPYLFSPHESATGIVFSRKYLLEEGGESFDEQTRLMNKLPIGSGPYQFVSRTRGQGMTFEAVDNHWRVSPEVRRVEWVLIPDPSTQLVMLQSGELDLVELDPDRVRQIEGAQDTSIYTFPGGLDYGIMIYFSFSDAAKSVPTSDVRVRHALSKAIDRKTIIDTLMHGFAKLPLAPWGVAPTADAVDLAASKPWADELATYDPEGAKALLAEAGYTDGLTLSMKLANRNGALPNTIEVTLAIVAQWAKIGVKVDIETIEYTTLRPYLNGDPDDPYIAGALVPFSNQPRFTSENFMIPWLKSGVKKTYLLDDPKLNALIEDIGQEPDAARRTALGTEAWDIVRDGWTSIHVLMADTLYGADNRSIASWQTRPGWAFLSRQIETIKVPSA